MGSVMGFTLEATGEPSVYWAGDTILYPPVLDTIHGFDPDVVVTHSCGALWDGVLIVMDAEQTVATCEAVGERAVVVATHMEALDHSTVDRAALRTHAERQGIAPGKLLIPADGETLVFAAGGAGARTAAQ
jgi:L-ascorbate metabolism protein UlaG (beta-lactamase superfamily)